MPSLLGQNGRTKHLMTITETKTTWTHPTTGETFTEDVPVEDAALLTLPPGCCDHEVMHYRTPWPEQQPRLRRLHQEDCPSVAVSA